MAQNSQRLPWTSEEVDAKLAKIMESAFNIGIKTATEYTKTAPGAYPSLVAGSNIGGTSLTLITLILGFLKVANAMHDQGEWW
jgi:glutamate dehydrogenase (NADP+)